MDRNHKTDGSRCLKTGILLGRPGAGKTAFIISTVNAHGGPALLVSLENTESILRRRGLDEKVHLLVPDDSAWVSEKGILNAV